MKLRILQILGLVLALTALAGAQTIQTKVAPDFTLPDIDGKNVTLSKNLGQGPVYVSFWATWCKPCMEELKIVEKLYEKYKGRGFQVFAIDSEGPKASGKIKSFVTSYGLTFRVLLDNDGEVFHRAYKGSNMPYTVIANSEGKIVFSRMGFKPGDEIEIEKIITENLKTAPTDTLAPADTLNSPKSE
jgi:cytochrome c biogenesis protein CcmG, thiol:disulfide interchange protein DsbE